MKIFVILDLETFSKNYTDISSIQNSEVIILNKLEISKWIAYFYNCKYIITDSFHGLCFSLIFKKPYIALKNRNRQRFDTIAAMLGYSSNTKDISIFDSVAEVYQNKELFKIFDFNSFDNIIQTYKNHCLNLLQSALNLVKPSSNTDNLERIYKNFDIVSLWRDFFTLQKEFAKISNNYYWSKFNEFWKFIPSELIQPAVFNENYVQILIKGLPQKIHYELLHKNDKPGDDVCYICLHCEDQTLKKPCKKTFSKISDAVGVKLLESSNKLAVNVPLINDNYVRDSVKFIYRTIDDVLTINLNSAL